MITRKETKQFLCGQLEKLHKEEHVDDLMKAGRIEELEGIAKELDFSGIEDFFDVNDNLFLEAEEIPESCIYELIFYFGSQSEWRDDEIFDDYEEIIGCLEEIGEDLAYNIAKCMESYDLRALSLEELLFEEEEYSEEEE